MAANGFTNSSSVLKSFKSLLSNNLISKVVVEKGLGYYIKDALFRAWAKYVACVKGFWASGFRLLASGFLLTPNSSVLPNSPTNR
jgi:hypothetical protein